MKLIGLLFLAMVSSSVYAENQIRITATVNAKVNTQAKMTHIDNETIKEDIYLQTNHKGGLTISLSNSSYGVSALLDYIPVGITPIDFSDKIYLKPTRVGELIVSQKKNKGYLGITISMK